GRTRSFVLILRDARTRGRVVGYLLARAPQDEDEQRCRRRRAIGAGPATPSPSFAGVGAFHHVDLHLRDALSSDAERLGGGAGDVDPAPANERAAVVDPNRDRAAGGHIGDAQPRAERQCAVRGGQFLRVELFAARGVRVVAVEAREPIACAFLAGGLAGGCL